MFCCKIETAEKIKLPLVLGVTNNFGSKFNEKQQISHNQRKFGSVF